MEQAALLQQGFVPMLWRHISGAVPLSGPCWLLCGDILCTILVEHVHTGGNARQALTDSGNCTSRRGWQYCCTVCGGCTIGMLTLCNALPEAIRQGQIFFVCHVVQQVPHPLHRGGCHPDAQAPAAHWLDHLQQPQRQAAGVVLSTAVVPQSHAAKFVLMGQCIFSHPK